MRVVCGVGEAGGVAVVCGAWRGSAWLNSGLVVYRSDLVCAFSYKMDYDQGVSK